MKRVVAKAYFGRKDISKSFILVTRAVDTDSKGCDIHSVYVSKCEEGKPLLEIETFRTTKLNNAVGIFHKFCDIYGRGE